MTAQWFRWLRIGVFCMGWLAATVASAQPAAAQAPGLSASAVDSLLAAGLPAAERGGEQADIKAMNRVLATMRASFLGWSAKERARVANARIAELLDSGDKLDVSVQDRPEGSMVLVQGRLLFGLLPADTVHGTLVEAKADARKAAATLALVAAESREARNLTKMLTAAAVALVATAVAVLLFMLLRRARARLQGWLTGKTLHQADRLRVGGLHIVSPERLVVVERVGVGVVYWLLLMLLAYQWLGVVLAQFPFTRAWGEQLNDFLLSLAKRFALGIIHALPDLFAAALIFAIAYGIARLLKRFFDSVRTGRVVVDWLDAEVALTTSRLCVAAVWLFALAMAYPYLPGSDTDAFKGLSVLVGLMISLGASNLVGQAASGLILTYTRTFRNGEYVRVAGHEGTVMSLGAFTTRIRTGMGEELTISNSQVLGDVTRNYSRSVKGKGYIVDTVVTIGYDTPWRQVNALLVEAALRTPGVLADPAPRVYQTALSDFYPEYRLVCQAVPSEPRPRAEVMNALHANIQDLFNEHGVQIMSPHYRGDPEQAKLVPPDQWYAPPARPPQA